MLWKILAAIVVVWIALAILGKLMPLLILTALAVGVYVIWRSASERSESKL